MRVRTKAQAELLAGELEQAWGYQPDTQTWHVGDRISLKLIGCILGPLSVLEYIAREQEA